MNRGLNLPSIQRIMNDFEKESSVMDMKEEMMSEAVDDVMDEEEDEEEEGDQILKEVLEEIGVDLSQQVSDKPHNSMLFSTKYPFRQLTEAPTGVATSASLLSSKQPVALGETAGPSAAAPSGSNAGTSDEDALQARLDALRRG